jgi:putative transcriptional regulator
MPTEALAAQTEATLEARLPPTSAPQSGAATRKTLRAPCLAAEARSRLGVSQAVFAALLQVSKRTLQEWEQGRREPTGAARALLRVALQHPEALRDLHPR